MLASAKHGYATPSPQTARDSMAPLLDLVLAKVPPPAIDLDVPFRMLVTTIDWSEYVGRIAIGVVEPQPLVAQNAA